MYLVESLVKVRVGDVVGFEFSPNHYITYKLTRKSNGILYDKNNRIQINAKTKRFKINHNIAGELSNLNTTLHSIKLIE